jgi:hypothetical protein
MIVGLDFETETDENNNCRPLICALDAETEQYVFDLTVREDYKKFIAKLITSGDTYVVFNAGFDVEIIMIMLLKNRFEFLDNEEEPRNRSMRLIMGQKIYSLSTYFQFNGELVETKYVDLGNLLVGSSLKDVAEKFTDLHKGDFETSKQDKEAFMEYCLLDAKITRVAYQNISNLLGGEYLTIGSASFNTMLNMNYEGKDKKEKFAKFKAVYGDNTLEIDQWLRKWYAGGLGWSSTDERAEAVIHSYDLKSAYPSECMGDLPTSIGMLNFTGFKEPTKSHPYAFIHMRVTGQVKENHVPVLPSRNIYGDSNIYIYDNKDVYIIKEFGKKSEYDFFLENIEIDDVEYIETVLMKNAKANPLKAYMEHFFHMKETTKGVERDFAKRMLNSLTGKLGTNPVKMNIQFRLDELNKLVRDSVEESHIDVYVTHVIAVIISRIRCKLYEVDAIIRDRVSFRMYATDSVKHSNEIKIIPTSNELGMWSLEHEDTEFIFLGLKAYIFDPNNKRGEREVMCAGISRNYKKLITNEQFYSSTKVKSLISVRAGNGRIIYEGYKKIVTPIKKPRRRSTDYEEYGGREWLT